MYNYGKRLDAYATIIGNKLNHSRTIRFKMQQLRNKHISHLNIKHIVQLSL